MARKFSLVEQYTKSFCNVPENILIPYSHTDGFLGLNPQPLRKIQFRLTYIPLKILAFKPPPLPLRISNGPCGGGMDIFWNRTLFCLQGLLVCYFIVYTRSSKC